MGQSVSQVLRQCFRKPQPEIRVGMLGLDNAGKTTILYQLKHSSDIQAVPTIGFNVETVRYGKYLLNIWDVSGSQPRTRVLWQHYNQHTRAIIFVIDAADVRRLPLAGEQLRWLWWRMQMANAVFLIYVNKQDLANALSAEEIAAFLQIADYPKHKWAIQECCALTGAGLWQGIQKLVLLYADHHTTTTNNNKSTLSLIK